MPSYDHDHLGEVLRAVDAQLARLLEVALPRDACSLPLHRESDAIRVVDEDLTILEASAVLFLTVRLEGDAALEWAHALPEQVRAGPRSELERLVAAGLPGVAVTYLPRPPAQLPLKSGYACFRLETDGPYWDRVRREGSLALYLPAALSSAQVELIALREEASHDEQ